MKKQYFRNTALYSLTAINVFYAVKNGFNWLSWVAISLSFIVFVWDIVEVISSRRERKI